METFNPNSKRAVTEVLV